MQGISTIKLMALAVLLGCTVTTSAWAQLNSTPQTVALAATAAESISVTITAPGPVNFNPLTGTTTVGSVTPAWTTNWDLKPQRNQVAVCVYLSGALTGTGGNADTIPAANVKGRPGGSGSFTALTANACGQSNALSISTTVIDNANRKNGSKNDSVGLEIDQTGLSLSADTYSGTLNIVAQATP